MAHVRSYASERPCQYCGEPFRPRKDSLKNGNGKFCTRSCSNQSQKNTTPCDAKDVISLYESGKTIHQVATELKVPWRIVRNVVFQAGVLRQSGQRLTKGYLTAYDQNGKRTKVHTIAAIEKIGRNLNANEIVHHINGDKMDNHQENLVVMTRKAHGKAHQQLEKLAYNLIKKGLITFNKDNGYTFSSEMEEFLSYV